MKPSVFNAGLTGLSIPLRPGGTRERKAKLSGDVLRSKRTCPDLCAALLRFRLFKPAGRHAAGRCPAHRHPRRLEHPRIAYV